MEKEVEKKNSGLGIAGLILGILAILVAWIPYINVLAYINGILALIFGIIAVAGKNNKKGMPIAAIVLAVIALILATIMNIVATKVIKDGIDEYGSNYNNVQDQWEDIMEKAEAYNQYSDSNS